MALASISLLEVDQLPDQRVVARRVRRALWSDGLSARRHAGLRARHSRETDCATATFDQSLEAIGPGGTIYLIGFLRGSKLELDLPKVFRRAVVLRGLSVGSRASFEEMNAAIEAWKLEPVIDRVFERNELVAALQYMEQEAMFGKIALRV